MKASEDHQEEASATSPSEEISGKVLPDPQKTASGPDTPPSPAAAMPSEAARADEQPTPPRIPKVRKKSGSVARQQPPAEPATPPPMPAAPEPEPGLDDLEWMPQPAEDLVARFLSDVAGMGPQTQEREASALPAFLSPTSASPEQAERKKARAEPFLSQVRATPMASFRKEQTQKRWRHRLIWLVVIAALLLLALLAAMLTLPHLSFLHLGTAAPGLLDARRAPMLE